MVGPGDRGSADASGFEPEGDTSVDLQLGPGTDVGGYLLDGLLGHGAMGFVYSGTHPLIGKRAAIKVLRPELSNDPTAVERFMREARAVNQIRHPNIVDIFAFGALPDGRSYYVMDLLAGESLRARLRRGPLHISEAASVIDETASALAAAHEVGLVHRDLKPDNVFMVETPGRWPEVRVLDWGLVKLAAGSRMTGQFRTATGSVLGTPMYMSPEQARASDTVDGRTDIYALGVMAYELLSGEPPFGERTSIEMLLAHQEDPVPPLGRKVPTLPDELVQLVEAMLEKDREARPTLAAVRAVLRRLKGTKIPTMSAAGLVMNAAMSSPDAGTRSPPGPSTEDDQLSIQQTMRRPKAPASTGAGEPEQAASPAVASGGDPLNSTAKGPAPPARPTPSPYQPSGDSAPYRPSYPSQPPGASYQPPGDSAPYRPSYPSQPPYAQQPYPSQPGAQAEVVAPSSRRWLVIASVAILLIAAGVAAAFLLA